MYTCFIAGAFNHIYIVWQLKKYFKKIKNYNFDINSIDLFAENNKESLPKIAIFVPARNEGYVIENTIKRLSKLDYPKDKYSIFIIVDERELDDDVEICTKVIVEKSICKLNPQYGEDFVNCIEVPKYYSGTFGDDKWTFEKSTKGRALNYALEIIKHNTKWVNIDMIGVLDADGRLDVDVLKEVAFKRISFRSKILQGPVFQVSNFSQISIVGIFAGLELAIYHMTTLPRRLLSHKIQFLAGTNYFIDKNLILEVNGWNQYTMVEDAELALRIYIEKEIKADWLSCPEIEQSPENFKIYKKQRERWVRGHLELIKDIFKSKLLFEDKLNLFFKIFISQFRFLFDFITISSALFLLLFSHITPFPLLSLSLLIISIFIWDLYGLMYRMLSTYIDQNMTSKNKLKLTLKLFVFMPVMIFIQAAPRFQALKNFLFYRKKIEWYKTERTKEIITE